MKATERDVSRSVCEGLMQTETRLVQPLSGTAIRLYSVQDGGQRMNDTGVGHKPMRTERARCALRQGANIPHRYKNSRQA